MEDKMVNEDLNEKELSENEDNLKDQKDNKETIKEETEKKEQDLNEKIALLENQLREMTDKYYRLFSEFDNYKKRTQKEKIELYKTSTKDIIIKLLPVLDDFERGLEQFKNTTEISAIKEGTKLIYDKILSIFTKEGLEYLDQTDAPFNSELHEAIGQVDMGKDKKGKVVQQIEKGYSLNGVVIRFAKVMIGS